ncbi:unnamed protein product, partial [Brassica oleracea]
LDPRQWFSEYVCLLLHSKYVFNFDQVELHTFSNEVVLREYVFASPMKHWVLGEDAMNSASHEESATVGRLHDVHVIGDVPR